MVDMDTVTTIGLDQRTLVVISDGLLSCSTEVKGHSVWYALVTEGAPATLVHSTVDTACASVRVWRGRV